MKFLLSSVPGAENSFETAWKYFLIHLKGKRLFFLKCYKILLDFVDQLLSPKNEMKKVDAVKI